MIKLGIGLVAAILLSWASPLWGHQTITWPYFPFPSLFIVTDKEVSGYGLDIYRLLWENLPEYEHRLISAPPSRMFAMMKGGDNWCAVGPVKTPDREEFMHFSLPCRVAFQAMVIVRKEDLGSLGGGPDISVTDSNSNSTVN